MKRGTPTHRKMIRLSRRLGISLPAAVGTMELLWQWTADNLPRGDIGRSEDWEIARAVYWEGDPQELMLGLVAEAWIDAHPVHRFIIHDWPEHCEDSVHTKLARAREFFADGKRPRCGKLGGAERDAVENFYRNNPQNEGQNCGNLHATQSEQLSLTLAHDVRVKGAQKDLAKPSQAKPSLISGERIVTSSETSSPLAAIAAKLQAAMGADHPPDSEICRQVAVALNGHPLEELQTVLDRLSKRKIRSYAFFPKVISDSFKETYVKPIQQHASSLQNLSEPVEASEQEIQAYLEWKVKTAAKLLYSIDGKTAVDAMINMKAKELAESYPGLKLGGKAKLREFASRAYFLEASTTDTRLQIASLAHYKAVEASKDFQADHHVKNGTEARKAESASGRAVLEGDANALELQKV